jgi:hypothetical protein
VGGTPDCPLVKTRQNFSSVIHEHSSHSSGAPHALVTMTRRLQRRHEIVKSRMMG